MSKKFRGKGIVSLVGKGKGVCPVCERKSVKLLWTVVAQDGNKTKVCKYCRNVHLNEAK